MPPTPEPTTPILTRRSLLAGLGGLGGAVLLGACSSGSSTGSGGANSGNAGTTSASGASSGGAAGGASTTGGGAAAKLNLVPRFDANEYAVAGTPQRLVVSVVTNANETPDGLPSSLDFRLSRRGENDEEVVVSDGVKTAAFQDGIPVPYFPVRVTPDQPGTYRLVTTVNGTEVATNFVVQPKGTLPLPTVGAKMPVTDTPTTADARGVKPICTRQRDGKEAFCAYHDLNLRDAVAAGKPTALLVSTPRFCQIGVCGPVLELFTEKAAAYPGVQFIHAEVYADPDSGSQTTAPVIDALGINFEPALFAVAADGTIAELLTHVFDRAEIGAALDKLK